MKTIKISYWATTGVLSAMYAMGALSYFFNYAHISEEVAKLGFPLFIIYPLAILKLSAVGVILTQKQSRLKEWAYAGITFNLLLAIGAHININDGEWFGAFVVLVLMASSYVLGKKYFAKA